jgi:uncharacterized membrane protein
MGNFHVGASYLIVLLLAALGSGLMGGVFFAFSNFVMAALARLAPAEGIRAMQMIDVTVLNRLFLSIFMGTGVLSIIAMVLSVLRWDGGNSACALAGGGAYIFGSIVATMRGNVPLNNALAALDADAPDSAQRWSAYVRDWSRWNHLRTIACLLAMALFALPLARGAYSMLAWRLMM